MSLSQSELETVEESEVGYFQHPAYSRSMLATLQVDGARMFEALYVKKTLTVDEDSLALKIGSLTHQEVLEPHLESKIKIIPEEVLSNGAKRGKPWKQYEAENKDYVLLKQSEADTQMGAVTALRKAMWGHIDNPLSEREHEIYWTHKPTGLELRAKLDLLVKEETTWWLPDLKTCADAKRFPREVASRALWLQAAHYRAAVRARYDREATFWFAVVEKSGTFRVFHYELDDEALEEADARYEKLLLKLKAHYDTGDWSEPNELGSTVLSRRQCFGWDVDLQETEIG